MMKTMLEALFLVGACLLVTAVRAHECWEPCTDDEDVMVMEESVSDYCGSGVGCNQTQWWWWYQNMLGAAGTYYMIMTNGQWMMACSWFPWEPECTVVPQNYYHFLGYAYYAYGRYQNWGGIG